MLVDVVRTRCDDGDLGCLLGLPAVARVLGIPKDRAYDLARQGELAVVTIGRYKRVRPAELERFIREHESQWPA